jgi:hypothetical protein
MPPAAVGSTVLEPLCAFEQVIVELYWSSAVAPAPH